ncbi:hypothetical protein CIG75_17805 [Tumebacillus algifaecis]|uniref:Uncharacterized protein n=1 Tax=Tumebacillus algifaecis TaxID=1214604 RepID=A0A223D579_9BACL|nr:hypothetical protein [Tumebacillus algifaecis]ASS76640.1 hypothetical protein CIG75_17805 [Tumebacillus algifaecis]
MPLEIVHDFLRENENGIVLTLYLSRNNQQVEFAEELGRMENPVDDRYLYAYIRRNYPNTPINHVQIVSWDHQVRTLSYMSILADVKPKP